jgi:hypothetical protein
VSKKSDWEFGSLEWIHRIREKHYTKTKGLPLRSRLEPVDPEKAAACRRLGLNIRVAKGKKRKTA